MNIHESFPVPVTERQSKLANAMPCHLPMFSFDWLNYCSSLSEARCYEPSCSQWWTSSKLNQKTRELKTTGTHLMLQKQHLYGLARPADYSIFHKRTRLPAGESMVAQERRRWKDNAPLQAMRSVACGGIWAIGGGIPNCYKITHNLTEWPWTLRKMTLTLTSDFDMQNRPRLFSSLRYYQAYCGDQLKLCARPFSKDGNISVADCMPL